MTAPSSARNDTIVGMSPRQIERFWGHVQQAHSCWLWTGRLNHKGYGVFSASGGEVRAHRVSFILEYGVPDHEMVIDHICRTRNCVNPARLRAVTPRENALENSNALAAINHRKTHCYRGHPIVGEEARLTLRMTPNRHAHRICRVCANANQNEASRRRKSA